MGQLYARGYEAGRETATSAKNLLKEKRPKELPGIAGKAVRAYRDMHPSWESRHADFQVGFWDGFYDRAEELRRLP